MTFCVKSINNSLVYGKKKIRKQLLFTDFFVSKNNYRLRNKVFPLRN
jgi:hypothetical protein